MSITSIRVGQFHFLNFGMVTVVKPWFQFDITENVSIRYSLLDCLSYRFALNISISTFSWHDRSQCEAYLVELGSLCSLRAGCTKLS